MFDFYDGGGLDACVLGLAQTDKEGNLNVSKFRPKVVGPGGFINISSSAKKVIFVGTLTAGAEYEIKDGTITISKEGNIKKFVNKVEQITFQRILCFQGWEKSCVCNRAGCIRIRGR